MRVLTLLGAMIAAAYFAAPTASAKADYCVVLPDEGGQECGYNTLQQCLDTRAGLGGLCVEDQTATPTPAPANKRLKRRAR
jgi:hypothetical protein